EQLIRAGTVGTDSWQRRSGNIQETVQINAHGCVKDPAHDLRRNLITEPLNSAMDRVGKAECMQHGVPIGKLVGHMEMSHAPDRSVSDECGKLFLSCPVT